MRELRYLMSKDIDGKDLNSVAGALPQNGNPFIVDPHGAILALWEQSTRAPSGTQSLARSQALGKQPRDRSGFRAFERIESPVDNFSPSTVAGHIAANQHRHITRAIGRN